MNSSAGNVALLSILLAEIGLHDIVITGQAGDQGEDGALSIDEPCFQKR